MAEIDREPRGELPFGPIELDEREGSEDEDWPYGLEDLEPVAELGRRCPGRGERRPLRPGRAVSRTVH